MTDNPKSQHRRTYTSFVLFPPPDPHFHLIQVESCVLKWAMTVFPGEQWGHPRINIWSLTPVAIIQYKQGPHHQCKPSLRHCNPALVQRQIFHIYHTIILSKSRCKQNMRDKNSLPSLMVNCGLSEITLGLLLTVQLYQERWSTVQKRSKISRKFMDSDVPLTLKSVPGKVAVNQTLGERGKGRTREKISSKTWFDHKAKTMKSWWQ